MRQRSRKWPESLVKAFLFLSVWIVVGLSVDSVLGAEQRPAEQRPSQSLFGEGYGRLYQQDQQMIHEMMEMIHEMMGAMKEMGQDPQMKSTMSKRMQRMDAMMKEHANRPSQTLFAEGYERLYHKDREMIHEMMEMMQEMMGMMKQTAQDPQMKSMMGKRMQRMETMMKEHAESPLKTLSGEGYGRFQQKR
jgi:DNA repair ATPase RecN